MDAHQRAQLVAALRFELKQSRSGSWTEDQQRQNYAQYWRGTRRPARVSRNATPERARLRQQRLTDWENSARGQAEGERLRLARERGQIDRRHPNAGDDLHRANVRMQSRTQMSGPNGVLRTITPHERVNIVGVRSRRRGFQNRANDPFSGPPVRRRRR